MLNELNAFDREHPFWTNTNRRPTVFKLEDFAEARLTADATDELALWTLAVRDSWCASNDFGSVYWKGLGVLGRLEIRWPIRAGLWHQMMLRFGGKLMADTLIDMGAQSVAQPFLDDMAQASHARIREWVHEVTRLLGENRA